MEQIGESQNMEEIKKVYQEYKINTTWDGRNGGGNETFEEWLPLYIAQFNINVIP